MTALHARLDLTTGSLEWVDAGHGLLLVLRADGRTESGAGDGLPLGVLPGDSWELQRTVLGAGDTLLAFSDGLVDLLDDDPAALDRIAGVSRAADRPARMVAELLDLAGHRPLPDDVTVLAARRDA